MTRIRYTNENGILVSKPIMAGSDIVVVRISPSLMSATISTTSGNEITSMTDKSVTLLKKNAKTFLKSMGVNFNDEVRRREVTAS